MYLNMFFVITPSLLSADGGFAGIKAVTRRPQTTKMQVMASIVQTRTVVNPRRQSASTAKSCIAIAPISSFWTPLRRLTLHGLFMNIIMEAVGVIRSLFCNCVLVFAGAGLGT